MANNILGIVFAVLGIKMLHINKFYQVILLLCFLFFYDIFWVFGSDVMVTVATKFDVPIKLKFYTMVSKEFMLGLGDIIIPALLACLALKFDVDTQLEEMRGKPKG